MIIVKLIGGLGNQMFQYAIGRHLAYINDTELKLDTSEFKTYKLRKYELGCFNIVEKFASDTEIKTFNLKRKFNIFFSNKNTSYNEKEKFKFDNKIFDLKGNIYINGNWQSEQYFKDIEHVIRQDFTIKKRPDGNNKQLINRILGSNSISVHIRRGDYVENKITNQVHGTCDLDYYHRSIECIIEKIKNPHFFIFSDDHLWAKNNLILKFPSEYVSHNIGKKDYEDMRLMSLCKHNIIANSSFSWWAAWLNPNKNKIVIAPKKWINDQKLYVKDLVPKTWLKK